MSAVYPLSQAGFSEFVTNLNERQRAGRKGPGRRAARRALNSNESAAPLTEMDPIPATFDNTDNEKALPPQYQPIEAAIAVSENEKAADAMPLRGGKNRGLGPRGRRPAQELGGEGPRGRRMRMALFEDGSFPSEEEVAAMAEVHRLRRVRRQNGTDATPDEQELAAMAEVRRLRRARRQANGIANNKGNGQGPRARRMQKRMQEQDVVAETSDNAQDGNQFKRGKGPRALRRRNNPEALGPRQMALRSGKVVDVSSDEEKTLVEPRGHGARGGRGGRAGRGRGGFKLERAPHEMPRGGPAKFDPADEKNAGNGGPRVPRFRKCGFYGGRNPHVGHSMNTENESEPHWHPGMHRPGMRRAMHGQRYNHSHIVPGPEDHQSGMAPPLRQREFKNRKQAGNMQNKRNGNKPGKQAKRVFKPRPDIYHTTGSYIVHMPLPGATQKDIGIMWDAEKYVLRIAGVIQRPAPEQVAEGAALVRAQRPTGVFRRAIRFGKKNEKVRIYENGITAKLEDGILKVEVPKYDGDDMTSDGEFVEVKQAY